MNGFKNCYYNNHTNEILLKEQGSTGLSRHKYHNWCYIEDPTGTSAIKDIYKKPVKKFPFDKKEEIQPLKDSGMVIAESDLRPEVKFMHEKYDDQDLQVDIDDWHICYFDIEVAGSSKYYDEHEIQIRILDKCIFQTVQLFDFDTKYKHKEAYEVFDEERQCWVNFADSCYVSYEFPAPEKAAWPINLVTCYSSKKKQPFTFGLKPLFGLEKDEPINYATCKNEIDLIDKFTRWFHKQEFDIMTGWNSVSYDVPYIINRCINLRGDDPDDPENDSGLPVWEARLSPFNKAPKARQLSDRKLKDVDLGSSYDIPGLYSIDYMEIYKTFGNHPPMPSYSLNYVSNFVLGDKKLDYDGSINETYKYDWLNFTRYNIKDVMLIVRMEEKCKLFPLLIEYAFDCIVTLDKIQNKVPTTTGYILRFLHKTNRVLNDKKENHEDWWAKEECYKIKKPDGSIYYQNTEWEDTKEFNKYLLKDRWLKGERDGNIQEQIRLYWKPKTTKGKTYSAMDMFQKDMIEFKKWPHPFPEFHVKAGYCYDYPGRFDDDMSFDITSSYPHHIMMFNISPEVVVRHPTKEQIESGEVILSDVNEVGFLRTDDAILPNVVKQVFAERKVWKKKEAEAIEAGNMELAGLYHNRQMTKKLIINSVYGVSLAEGFHLYNPDCARAICMCARVTLRDWLSKYMNEYYLSKQILKDMNEFFPTIIITVNNKDYAYLKSDKLTVMRNNQEMEIEAKDFNMNTDMLGLAA